MKIESESRVDLYIYSHVAFISEDSMLCTVARLDKIRNCKRLFYAHRQIDKLEPAENYKIFLFYVFKEKKRRERKKEKINFSHKL